MTKTFKSMARMVKDDLPKLLGYEHTEMFLFDNVKKNLYCMSIDGEKQDSEEAKMFKGFENEYIVRKE